MYTVICKGGSLDLPKPLPPPPLELLDMAANLWNLEGRPSLVSNAMGAYNYIIPILFIAAI